MHRFVIFNWKLDPPSREEAEKLFAETKKAAGRAEHVTVVACPPFQYLFDFASSVISHKLLVALGAQDSFWEDAGAFTGEVSPLVLKQAGVSYVIVGHSERALVGETDDMVSRKLVKALETGLVPVLCVGDQADVHAKGARAVERFLEAQMRARLARACTLPLHQKSRMLVAYEPVWSISGQSGNVADAPEDASRTVVWMKNKIEELCAIGHPMPVLYGGSVNAKNVQSFCRESSIDGFLVGHASLNSAEVRVIVDAADDS